jgi:3-oxoacyl-[acyl-carrier protein] reductase
LDFVIANAGLGVFKPVDELSIEDWSAMIDTNLTGIFYTLKASVDSLKKNRRVFYYDFQFSRN